MMGHPRCYPGAAMTTRDGPGYSSTTPKIGKPTMDLVPTNRKTELCRNWRRGRCFFTAAECAFAHGEHDLKHQTLNEMEHTGRIPNATKFRCYPCLTWVATGSCPYFSRCVFIHDPRIRGPTEAYLYQNSQASCHNGGGGGKGSRSPLGRDAFYWPDMPRTDAHGHELPAASVNYDMDPSMLDSSDPTERAVYQLWYSLVGTVLEIAAQEPESITPTTAPCEPFSVSPRGGSCSFFETLSAVGDAAGGSMLESTTGPSSSYYRPPWRTKDPSRRLPLFLRMSKAMSVSPSYVPVPTATGPRHIWKDPCKACQLADRLAHGVSSIAPSPRALRARNRNVQQAPVRRTVDASVALSTTDGCSTAKPASSLEPPAWQQEAAMGEENRRPRGAPPSGGDGSRCVLGGAAAHPLLSRGPSSSRVVGAKTANELSRAYGAVIGFDNVRKTMLSSNSGHQENEERLPGGYGANHESSRGGSAREGVPRPAFHGSGREHSYLPEALRVPPPMEFEPRPPPPPLHLPRPHPPAPCRIPSPLMRFAAATGAETSPAPFSRLASATPYDSNVPPPPLSKVSVPATPGLSYGGTAGSRYPMILGGASTYLAADSDTRGWSGMGGVAGGHGCYTSGAGNSFVQTSPGVAGAGQVLRPKYAFDPIADGV